MLFFNSNKIKPIERNFQAHYLLDNATQKQLETDGYCVLKNIVKEDEIQLAQNAFDELKKMDGYDVTTIFKSTGNFKSFELQKQVFQFIETFMSKIADRFANLENCEIGKGGAFFIKPNSTESQLDPHQDSTVVDETKDYALFVWIPLTDVTKDNGALYVLPKSHLYGNFYRSQHIPWAFRKRIKELWKMMLPIYVKKGDVILFDASIIHASSINYTDKYRVVVCGALLSNKHQKVDYLLNKKEIEQYYIDDNYWLQGGTPDLLKNYDCKKMHYTFPNPISKSELNSLYYSK